MYTGIDSEPGAGAAGRRAADYLRHRWRRHTGAAITVPRRRYLAAARGPQARRRVRAHGIAGGEDAGMRILEWACLDAQARAAVLRRPSFATAGETSAGVVAILAAVAAPGAEALRDSGHRIDGLDLVAFAAAAPKLPSAKHAA